MDLIKLNLQELQGERQVVLMKGEPAKIQLRIAPVFFPLQGGQRSPNSSYAKVKRHLSFKKSSDPLIEALRWWSSENRTEM